MIPRDSLRRIGAGLLVLGATAALAAVPVESVAPIGTDTSADVMSIDINEAAAHPKELTSVNQAPSGNPLWAIPLKELPATRERPIFSPSRRPPAPAVAAALRVPPPAPPKPVEPPRPRLSLVGTIAGEDQAFGIFMDQTANKSVRLKMGQVHDGWILREVHAREIVFQKDDEKIILALPAPTTPFTDSKAATDEPAAR